MHPMCLWGLHKHLQIQWETEYSWASSQSAIWPAWPDMENDSACYRNQPLLLRSVQPTAVPTPPPGRQCCRNSGFLLMTEPQNLAALQDCMHCMSGIQFNSYQLNSSSLHISTEELAATGICMLIAPEKATNAAFRCLTSLHEHCLYSDREGVYNNTEKSDLPHLIQVHTAIH